MVHAARTRPDLDERAHVHRREPIILQMQIPPASAGELDYEFRQHCTIERLYLRFYEGQQRQLRVRPMIWTPKEVLERLFEIDTLGLADDFLAGNNDVLDLWLVRPVRAYSHLRLEYENIDPAEPYTLYALLELDYRGGLYSAGGGA